LQSEADVNYVLTITPVGDAPAIVTTHESEAAAHDALLRHAEANGYNIYHGNANSTAGELEGQVTDKSGSRYWETVEHWTVVSTTTQGETS
jgi:hypothetical protein